MGYCLNTQSKAEAIYNYKQYHNVVDQSGMGKDEQPEGCYALLHEVAATPKIAIVERGRQRENLFCSVPFYIYFQGARLYYPVSIQLLQLSLFKVIYFILPIK